MAHNFDTSQSSPEYPWFALRVRSNHERVTSLHLRENGYDEFCPAYKSERKWSDRKKTVEQVLFPGYVFCRLNPESRLPILIMPGVVNIVGFGTQPAPIPEQEIEHVRAMAGSGLLVTPWPFLAIGQTVLLERGPLAGVEGILQQIKKTYRLVVSVQMLQRSVSTEVDRDWVRPVKAPAMSVRLSPSSLSGGVAGAR